MDILSPLVLSLSLSVSAVAATARISRLLLLASPQWRRGRREKKSKSGERMQSKSRSRSGSASSGGSPAQSLARKEVDGRRLENGGNSWLNSEHGRKKKKKEQWKQLNASRLKGDLDCHMA